MKLKEILNESFSIEHILVAASIAALGGFLGYLRFKSETQMWLNVFDWVGSKLGKPSISSKEIENKIKSGSLVNPTTLAKFKNDPGLKDLISKNRPHKEILDYIKTHLTS